MRRGRWPLQLGLLVAGAVLVTLINSVQDHLALSGRAGRDPFGYRFVHMLPPWLIAALLVPAVVVVVRRWPLQLRIRSVLLHGAMSVAFALAHFTLLASFHAVVWPSPRGFGETVWLFVVNYFVFYVLLYWALAWGIQAVESARAMRRKDELALRLQAQLADARLAALRSQLNPHFLFNVLNTASMLARDGRTDEVVDVLARLGDLLRYVLSGGASGDSTLGDELEFLRGYLALEQVRFVDRLEVQVDADPALEDLRIPSLLLQPLVENAIRHGISGRPGAGRIEIRARRDGAQLLLEVRDDGVGLPARPREGGIGVLNTRARLAERYGPSAELALRPMPGGGTSAEVRLPAEGA
ncbi:MAG TPA: histidine kinase [Myxococcaceae bacterium]|nr:histidine kinase [Myxococcaceae bacterium]